MSQWLLYAPFIVFGLLFPINIIGHNFIYPLLGISEGKGVAVSMLLIGVGLILGLIGVITNRQMRWYWRIPIAILFIPAIGASLIISGM